MEKLIQYDWPGNIRELRNTVEYAFVLCSSKSIGAEHLPSKITNRLMACPENPSTPAVDQKEKAALVELLRKTGGNQSEAARRLGVSRITIWKRMKKYGIDLKKEAI
jgi:transcriptional regulator of acetoin/glycerol metabolism